ncbi:kinesin-like protein [Caerostris extrusa]|uniref:Kinesin-like protein n=1 Tax=Caerostris extrusa TaxID=172846 RepID=A0AAV4XEP5_CAEEX|nr:kinesin-like protein [Caerostris extrusa]
MKNKFFPLESCSERLNYMYEESEMAIKGRKYPEITYEMAQEEIAAKAGINPKCITEQRFTGSSARVEVANSISEELDKRVRFEIMLVSPQMIGKSTGRTEARQTNIDCRSLIPTLTE